MLFELRVLNFFENHMSTSVQKQSWHRFVVISSFLDGYCIDAFESNVYSSWPPVYWFTHADCCLKHIEHGRTC
jgi:hypothetical protein